ncbi:MAG: hypothetical protein K9K64_02770 [Desulfohalobiaceae bacterium]|nr:hypothetical protein [Desulfohalobiaceae bacterium]MCF8104383.1 hypothetical protein [Desulfohalobiaceae bacterium]
MFWLELISIVLGSFLQLVFVTLICLSRTKYRLGKRLFFRINVLCLTFGASLVMLHAFLARDVVLFVGQLIALIMFYRWLTEARDAA